LLNDAASGEDIWNRLVKLHANSLMVLNGHWIQGGPYNPAHLHSGARHAYLGSQADAGQIVHQLFTNYQEEPNAGDGWFTLIRFKPSLGRIAVWQVKTFNCTANCTDTGSPGDSYEITYRPPRVAANQAPEVNAGTDQKVTLPGAALEGSVRDDGLPLGSVVTSAWTRASGPGQAIFTDPKVPKTMATFSAPGVYVLRLTASDTELSAYDEVEITVEQPGEHPRDQIRRRRR
jgi:hypothetical protein